MPGVTCIVKKGSLQMSLQECDAYREHDRLWTYLLSHLHGLSHESKKKTIEDRTAQPKVSPLA